MFSDINLVAMLQIAAKVIKENLGVFFNAKDGRGILNAVTP
jgi:hypothetical protein